MSRCNPRDRRVKMLRLRKDARREADAKKRMEREKLRRRFFSWLDGKEIEE